MFSLKPYGPNAWLIEHPKHDQLLALGNTLETDPPAHYLEYSLGYDTLLIQFNKPVTADSILSYLGRADTIPVLGRVPRHHDIPVRYDGPDLEDTARALKLSCMELVTLHTAPLYQVRFLGFSPGFPYLDGLPERIHLPRRSTPRTRVQAGAVAIGGSHASIYSISSPGGWHWLGNTDYTIFDRTKQNAEAFSLQAGDTLTFIPIHA